MKKFIDFAAACALLCAASSASAITYVANRAVGAGFVNLSITTDNTLGVLTASNIIDWSVLLADGSANPAALLQGPGGANNSSWTVQGNNLTATATDLYFDFSASAGNIAYVYGSGTSFYCFQTSGCHGGFGAGEIVRVVNTTYQPVSGNQIIASAAGGAVPEPGAWALMLAGFGLAGSALRARRRTLAA